MPDYKATQSKILITHCNVAADATDRTIQLTLSPQRAHVRPEPGESFAQLVARVMPEEESGGALEKLKSWNLHIFLRRPSGLLLGSDIVFVEPPR